MQIFYKFSGHSDDSTITAIDITSNGQFVLSGSSSGTLSLMDLESSGVVQMFEKTKDGAGIRLVSVLKDDASFVFIDEANRVEIRTFNNDVVHVSQPNAKVTSVTSLGLSCVLFGFDNGELSLFDYDEQHKYNHQAHSEAVTQLESRPKKSFLYFASGSSSGSVKLWFVTKTGLWKEIWSHDKVHPHPITALAFVPDSKDILIGSYGNEVCSQSTMYLRQISHKTVCDTYADRYCLLITFL